MNEAMRKKVVFATLPLALLWAVYNFMGQKQPPAAVNATGSAYQTIAPIKSAAEPRERQINIVEKQAEPWGEDPFRTVAEARGQTSQPKSSLAWVLGGIIYSEQAPVAFINKQMVRVGDQVGAAQVVAINKKTVLLNLGGRQITLKLNKG